MTARATRPVLRMFASTCILALCTGCRGKAPAEKAPLINHIFESYSQVSGSVGFDITPLPSLPDGTKVWLAHYSTKEGTTEFQIQLRLGQADRGIAVGKGAFVSVEGSNPKPLLNALKKELEAKQMPLKPQRVNILPFVAASLGTGQVRLPEGGFEGRPGGTWTAIKIFLPGSQDDDAEVFLNISETAKKAEFSIKDADYGDDILADLATVL